MNINTNNNEDQTEHVAITFEEYIEFKHLYHIAKKANKQQFKFKGIDVLTQFAKYMIEHIDKSVGPITQVMVKEPQDVSKN